MAPTRVHLIRHAQGYHNLRTENHRIRDPLLTPKGEQQCLELSREITDIHCIDCILASPLRRTLHTALLMFRDLLLAKPDLKIIALPELQETSALSCDVGLTPQELRREFKDYQIDLSRVKKGWNNKLSGPFAARNDRIFARACAARKFIESRQEHQVAVVTHGGLLHYITGDWFGSMDGIGTGWKNCEIRTYVFDRATADAIASAALAETNESLLLRRFDRQFAALEQQRELQVITEHSWAADGYIVLADATTTSSEEQVAVKVSSRWKVRTWRVYVRPNFLPLYANLVTMLGRMTPRSREKQAAERET